MLSPRLQGPRVRATRGVRRTGESVVGALRPTPRVGTVLVTRAQLPGAHSSSELWSWTITLRANTPHRRSAKRSAQFCQSHAGAPGALMRQQGIGLRVPHSLMALGPQVGGDESGDEGVPLGRGERRVVCRAYAFTLLEHISSAATHKSRSGIARSSSHEDRRAMLMTVPARWPSRMSASAGDRMRTCLLWHWQAHTLIRLISTCCIPQRAQG